MRLLGKFIGAVLGISFSVLLTLGLLEFAFRLMIPCDVVQKSWKTQSYPEIGNLMKPDTVVQCSNIVDYCVTEKTNKWGFLDREPPPWDVLKDKFRIAFVGDSYVEAVQVKIPEKAQVLLEKELNSKLNSNVYAAGFGYSGVGQVQELKIMERFAKQFHPDVVVLYILSNDFKNNSWLLQALDDGVEPEHPIAVEIRPSFPFDGKTWELIPPDPLPKALPSPPDAAVRRPALIQWLQQKSMLYNWCDMKTRYVFPKIHEIFVAGKQNEQQNPYPVRVNAVRKMGEQYASLLADFPKLGQWSIESQFDKEKLPAAWEMALKASEYVMDKWIELARQENFKLVIFITSTLKRDARDNAVEPRQFERWVKILQDRNLPYIDQDQFLESRNYDKRKESFSRDGHWSPQGHIWGAESMFEFFKNHPEFLSKIRK